MQGRLIVFEGGEGAGKTTQLQRSRQWLVDSGWLRLLQAKGIINDIVMTREPGGTVLGQSIRRLLLEKSDQDVQDKAELLLYAADRAQHVEEFLRPQLQAGALILCDRYTDSTVAYQGYGRGLNLQLIEQLNQIATDGLTSDLTLWLDLEAAIGLARTQRRGIADRIEQVEQAFHERVRQGFGQLANQHSHRMVRIDASQPEELVAQQIQSSLTEAFHQWFGITLEHTGH